MGSQIHGPYDLLNPIQTLLKVFVNTLAIPSISFPQGVFSIFHRAPIGSLEIDWGLYGITLSIHCGNWGISESSPSFAMNDSETRRSPHKGIDSYRKNKLLFGILLTLQCCYRWIHRDRKATRESFTKTQMEKLWFTMFCHILLPPTA